MSRPPRHYNPLLVTVLPKERKARHPYQLAPMMCLLTLGMWQLTVGVASVSSMGALDDVAFYFLNWMCILSGAAGLLAAVIPEHIVSLRIRFLRWVFRTEFDATYFRLWEELGAHVLLFTVWCSFGQTVWENYGVAKGYSLGLAAAIWYGWAALWRALQVWLTIYRAGTFSHKPTAIVGDSEIL